jgi:hypothetical protein
MPHTRRHSSHGIQGDIVVSEWAGENKLNADHHIQKDMVQDDFKHGETQTAESVAPVDEKTTLQDQTNLLPVKQLLVVFVGLSSALFCESNMIWITTK